MDSTVGKQKPFVWGKGVDRCKKLLLRESYFWDAHVETDLGKLEWFRVPYYIQHCTEVISPGHIRAHKDMPAKL